MFLAICLEKFGNIEDDIIQISFFILFTFLAETDTERNNKVRYDR